MERLSWVGGSEVGAGLLGRLLGTWRLTGGWVTVAWRRARSPAWLGGCEGPGAGLGSWARAVGDLGAFDRGMVREM